MFEAVEKKAKSAARKVTLSAAGGLSLMVGLGFLTTAAWIYLTAVADVLTAAVVIGAAYTGMGLILLGVSTTHSSATTMTEPKPEPTAPPLMQAFLHGMQAGTSAQRR